MKRISTFLSVIAVSAISFAGIPDNTEQLAYLYGLQDTTAMTASDSTAAAAERSSNYRFPGRAMIFSGIVPGLGELYTGNWKRAALFAGLEVTAWIMWSNFNSKGDDQTKLYEAYADEHWEFSRWLADFYRYEDVAEFNFLFSDTTDEVIKYTDVWEASHNVAFIYTNWQTNRDVVGNTSDEDHFIDGIFSSVEGMENIADLREFLRNATPEDIDALLEADPNFLMVRDQTYYENIGKYNHFYSGWDDTWDPSDLAGMPDYIFDNDGYMVAKSPNKWHYRDMRGKANDYKSMAGYAVSAMMLNHVASMIDAVLTTHAWNSKQAPNISARAMFNPENKLGLGGVEVSLSW